MVILIFDMRSPDKGSRHILATYLQSGRFIRDTSVAVGLHEGGGGRLIYIFQ